MSRADSSRLMRRLSIIALDSCATAAIAPRYAQDCTRSQIGARRSSPVEVSCFSQ